jgi:hypothetical protein
MLTLALLALLGCAPTCNEVEGAICADDVQALQERMDQLEAAGATYAWFDQDGVQVTDGPELVWFDEAGVLWQVDADRGIPDAYATEYDVAGTVFHMTEDCSDPGYYGGLASPKVAFYNGDARDDYPVYVRDASPDEIYARAVAYEADSGECREGGPNRDQHLVPTTELHEIARPDVVWPAPLYPKTL